MVPGNFNWFIHTMLFYHTRYVLEKQDRRRRNEDNNNNNNDVDVDDDDDVE
jgi:hypothetical protein